jgi:SAM-dependent methyltransferase
VPVPVAAPVSTDTGPTLEFDVHIDVELPEAVAGASPSDLVAALDAAAAALEASSVEAPSVPANLPPIPPEARRPPMRPPPVELSGDESVAIPSEARRPPMPPPPVELSGDEFSPEAIAKKIAAAEAAEAAEAARAARGSEAGEEKPAESGQAAEELGREDAISMPPEEVAALEDAAKPPPPPKRALGIPASAPPAVESPPASSAPAKEPPTPDLAAAKAAQRSKTRQPWWEDLFNEDFMRASSRVSDEHIRREVTFIEESLGVAAGGVVLDLGCGAGHHAVEFASRGYGVVGYDLSLYQLALAADVAQERSQKINFLQGDMREMAFEEMFDGVFCWNTTFGYFEEDKNLAVAQRVFKALRPGGMFLIDVLNRDFAAASAPCTVWYEGDSCVCMDDMSVDYISSRLRVKRSIILDDGRTKESLFSLRLYSLHELGKLLHEVGFRVTEASGHPATPGVFFGPNSPRIIMLAQRP